MKLNSFKIRGSQTFNLKACLKFRVKGYSFTFSKPIQNIESWNAENGFWVEMYRNLQFTLKFRLTFQVRRVGPGQIIIFYITVWNFLNWPNFSNYVNSNEGSSGDVVLLIIQSIVVVLDNVMNVKCLNVKLQTICKEYLCVYKTYLLVLLQQKYTHTVIHTHIYIHIQPYTRTLTWITFYTYTHLFFGIYGIVSFNWLLFLTFYF